MTLQEWESGPTNSVTDDWEVFEVKLYSVILERRFFITTLGYFGLGPSALQVGDNCCVLLGCRMPLVIRPISMNGHFNLVGASRIYGAMHGEMVEKVESISDLTEITLV
jgi:hypothetical protein